MLAFVGMLSGYEHRYTIAASVMSAPAALVMAIMVPETQTPAADEDAQVLMRSMSSAPPRRRRWIKLALNVRAMLVAFVVGGVDQRTVAPSDLAPSMVDSAKSLRRLRVMGVDWSDAVFADSAQQDGDQ